MNDPIKSAMSEMILARGSCINSQIGDQIHLQGLSYSRRRRFSLAEFLRPARRSENGENINTEINTQGRATGSPRASLFFEWHKINLWHPENERKPAFLGLKRS